MKFGHVCAGGRARAGMMEKTPSPTFEEDILTQIPILNQQGTSLWNFVQELLDYVYDLTQWMNMYREGEFWAKRVAVASAARLAH